MYRTAVTICTAQWSLYVPHIGHYMYRTLVTIRTVQWSLYVPHSLTFISPTFCPHSVLRSFSRTSCSLFYIYVTRTNKLHAVYINALIQFLSHIQAVWSMAVPDCLYRCMKTLHKTACTNLPDDEHLNVRNMSKTL
jgi:hypothetical protein